MSSLQGYIDRRVCVVTSDGRVLFGVLRAFDNQTNLVLTDTVERVFRGAIARDEDDDDGCIDDPQGTLLLRGENVAMVGEVDQAKDKERDWASVVAPPLKGFRSWAT